MPVYVSLLKGINDGGNRKCPMVDLRALHEELGHTDVRTLIQSGNVVFRAKDRNATKLAATITDAVEKRFGFRTDIMIRTAAELRQTVAKNPFAARPEVEGNKLLILFLNGTPTDEAAAKMRAIPADPEEVHLVGNELFIWFPAGMGQTKLQLPAYERALKLAATGRNLNTVQKLVAMVDALE